MPKQESKVILETLRKSVNASAATWDEIEEAREHIQTLFTPRRRLFRRPIFHKRNHR